MKINIFISLHHIGVDYFLSISLSFITFLSFEKYTWSGQYMFKNDGKQYQLNPGG